MSAVRGLIHEIHRRSLWQVLGIYLAGSWIVFQVAQSLTEGMGLPDWVPPVAVILLLIGLPIVIATAFVQEGMGRPGRREAVATEGPSPPDVDLAPETAARPENEAPAVRGGRLGPRHRLFTWRNALLGGGAAFALLGVATAGYMLMRTLGIGPAGTLVAAGVLGERERILVADFSSATGDSSLATVVTEAFRVDLSQSRTVALVDPARVATILERMGRPPGTPLDLALAREIAQRDDIKVVLDGQVDAAGSGYVLTASLVSAEDGEVLVSGRQTAASADDVIDGIDELSDRIRERVGESLRSLRRTPPLEHVTTPSLEALRYYSQAERAALVEGQDDRAIAWLEEAVGVDTGFAMAWRKLGVLLGNRGDQPSRALHAFERALAHADRLPDRERFLTQGSYYQQGTGEVEKAITAYENLLTIDPKVPAALNNLGLAYDWLRDPVRAAELYTRALASDSSALTLVNLARAQAAMGRWDVAKSTQARLEEKYPDNPIGQRQSAWLNAALSEYDAARASFEALQRLQAGSSYWTTQARLGLASIDAATGRLSDALRHLDEVAASADARRRPAEALRVACYAALVRIFVAGDRAGGLQLLERALAEHPADQADPLDRPYLQMAAVFAAAGRPDRAQAAYDDFAESVPSLVQSGFSPTDHWHAVAEVALAENRIAEAEEAFRRADAGFCLTCALPGLARAQESAGRRGEAIATYELYLGRPYLRRLGTPGIPFLWPYGDWLFLGPTYERLGQLYDEKGDLENAAKHYALFTDLWAEADPELQPRVGAARARLEEIMRKRG